MPAYAYGLVIQSAPNFARGIPALFTGGTDVWIYIATLVGGAVFVVGWATGLGADVSGLIWLGVIGVGIFAQMAERPGRRPEGG
jgi:hypothetical protein